MGWEDNTLHLPNLLWAAYADELTGRAWLNDAQINPEKSRIYGGNDEQATKDHFCQRFAASCSRLAYFLTDPENHFRELKEKTLISFSRGELIILDVCGGSGAATISILTSLADLRLSAKQPCLPLNISIVNADISDLARTIAHSIHMRMGTVLLDSGINITFQDKKWDMFQVEQTNQLCDEIFDQSLPAREYLILVSNISGLGAEQFDIASDSIAHIMQRITNKKAFVLWVEPPTSKAQSILKKVAKILASFKFLKPYFPDETPTYKYKWMNEIKNAVNEGRITIQQFLRNY